MKQELPKPQDSTAEFIRTMAAIKDACNKVWKGHVDETARIIHKYGPEKSRVILDRLYSLRDAKRRREFNEYTTKPCGCYRDPGGHP